MTYIMCVVLTLAVPAAHPIGFLMPGSSSGSRNGQQSSARPKLYVLPGDSSGQAQAQPQAQTTPGSQDSGLKLTGWSTPDLYAQKSAEIEKKLRPKTNTDTAQSKSQVGESGSSGSNTLSNYDDSSTEKDKSTSGQSAPSQEGDKNLQIPQAQNYLTNYQSVENSETANQTQETATSTLTENKPSDGANYSVPAEESKDTSAPATSTTAETTQNASPPQKTNLVSEPIANTDTKPSGADSSRGDKSDPTAAEEDARNNKAESAASPQPDEATVAAPQ